MEKLDCKSLMIGDWVCYSKPNNYCTKVNEIKCTHDVPDDMLYYIKGQRDNRDRLKNEFDETFVVDILSPIPLTPEILEKNGWIKGGYFYKAEDGSYIQLGELFEHASFRAEKHGIPREIQTSPHLLKYVHQLQHALRLCGIEKEIML